MSAAAPLSLRAQNAVARANRHVPSRPQPLAGPPPGSALRPVLGEWGAPLIGHSFSFVGDTLAFARRWVARYGEVSWCGSFGTKVVLVFGPDAFEEVFVNRERAFSNEQGWDYFIGPFFHRGVMLMDFEEHLHHRRIMQAAFRRERLEQYLASMTPAIARGLEEWQPGPGFRLYERTKQLTLDLASEVFVGTRLGPEADAINRALVATVVGGATLVRSDVPGGRWHRGLKGRRLLQEFFASQLPAKRAAEGSDLFSVLCHAESDTGERFSDDDVVNHMIFVLMAAHDTSTLSLSMMAYLLAKHPAWQERLRAESRALGTASPSFEALEQLPSLDLALKETLRMFGPVGVLFRKALRDTELRGRYIPAGTLLSLNLYASQRMEPWWQAPDSFDPERFAEPRREDRSHRYAWTPFGGGAHKCIGLHFGGMEVKAIMHQLLLRFRWSVEAGYEVPLTYGTGPTPGDGLPLHLQRL
jgi:cytochrome P450